MKVFGFTVGSAVLAAEKFNRENRERHAQKSIGDDWKYGLSSSAVPICCTLPERRVCGCSLRLRKNR
jgi:hypothetical protein